MYNRHQMLTEQQQKIQLKFTLQVYTKPLINGITTQDKN